MRGRSSLGRRVRNRWVVEGMGEEMMGMGWWFGVRNTLLLLDKRSDYQSETIVRMNIFMNLCIMPDFGSVLVPVAVCSLCDPLGLGEPL